MDINEKLYYCVFFRKDRHCVIGSNLKIEDGFLTMAKFQKYKTCIVSYKKKLDCYTVIGATSVPISQIEFIQECDEGMVPAWAASRTLERAEEIRKRYIRMLKMHGCIPTIKRFFSKSRRKKK